MTPDKVHWVEIRRANLAVDEGKPAMKLADLVAWAQSVVDSVPHEHRQTAEIVVHRFDSGFFGISDVAVRYPMSRPLTPEEIDSHEAQEYARLRRKFEASEK